MSTWNEYDQWKLDNGEKGNGEELDVCEHCEKEFSELHETVIHRKIHWYCEDCQIEQQLEWTGSEE